MNDEELSARLYRLLAEHFELDPAKVTPEARLYEDLGLDSIDAVDLALAVEDLTGCETTPNDFQNASTVADVETIIRKLVAAK
ncbi:MAG: acyl carrier protein [Gammaproteobacteria bacterium]|nr:acyl carrier protein [Gammaproteobacteria bacterium]